MGLEAYGVLLAPSPTRALFTESLVATLRSCGLTLLEPTIYVGNAKLGEAPQDETNLLLNGRDYIIEVQIKADQVAPKRVGRVSVRFALCQPRSAVDAFFKVVGEIVRDFDMHVLNMRVRDPNKPFYPNGLQEFRQEAEQSIATQKARWRAIFNDAEELPMRVEQAWAHFDKKHPDRLLKLAEGKARLQALRERAQSHQHA